jgi:S-adenosylmethionine:tRNA ribosyltransferase-isomerase
VEEGVVIAAATTRADPETTRLLRVDPGAGTLSDGALRDLPRQLRHGDVLVVNDAATLPASLRGRTTRGEPVEARLAGRAPDGTWRAVIFGAGDWRTRTEDRPDPPPLAIGDRLRFDDLGARVCAVDPGSRRLVALAFEQAADDFWPRLYRAGRPVQYAHAAAPLALWDVQTAYAARPWAVEAPSAGFGLSWEVLLGVRARGIVVVPITHAAGLSSTGDRRLDARLPLREAYEIPEATARAVAAAKSGGGRVVALGTTAARALEGAAFDAGGVLASGAGETDFLLGPETRLAIVDGIVTGVHEAESSHFRLLEAFAPRPLLERALALSAARGYRGHEFGDAWLVLRGDAAPGPH